MPSKSKRKGNAYETELVKHLQRDGFRAVRAWGSNGKALGESEEVDLVLTDGNGSRWRVQAKRRARIADYIKPPADTELVFVREDRGETLVVMSYQTLINLLKASTKEEFDAILS
jgi:Holliday junction resolvase